MSSLSQAARAYAAHALGLDESRQDELRVRTISGGETHQIFRVTVRGEEDFVVRVNNAEGEYVRRKAQREAMALRGLDSDFAPRLIHYDKAAAFFRQPAMVTTFLSGEKVDLAHAEGRVLESLGATIGRLHDLDPDRVALLDPRPRSLSEYLVHRIEWDIGRRIYEDRLPGDLASRFWGGYRRVAEAALECVTRDEWLNAASFSLLHGDAHGDNVVWSGSMAQLVDWEDVRLGDPAEEVAFIFTENQLTEADRARFWEGYARTRGSRAGPVGQRVATWEPVTMFGSAMWWLDRYCLKLRARRTGVPNAVVPRALSYYRKVAVSMLRRFESRYPEPS